MHELGVAHDLFHIVEDKAKDSSLKAVTKIVVVVGEASGIEEDFLKHSLTDYFVPGTIAEKAEVQIVREKFEARCPACGREIDFWQAVSLSCTNCGNKNVEVTKGKTVYLQTIEGE